MILARDAYLVPDGQGYRVVPSEGGHADFAPRDELQGDPLRFLGAEFGHVSRERVLSGPGLANIDRFLQTRAGPAAPDWLRERLGREDHGGVVGGVGLSGRDAKGRLDTLLSSVPVRVALDPRPRSGARLEALMETT